MRIKLVAAGKGITFADDEFCKRDLFKGVTFIDIEDAPPLQPMTLYWHKDRALSVAAKAFLENIIMYM